MFSKATEYAIRAVLYIAQKSTPGHKIGLNEIATAIDSPQYFTAKILQILSKEHNLIMSTRGINGGFYMTTRAKNLPVSAILKAMKEDGVLEKCVIGLHKCSETKPCPLHKQYKEIRNQLMQMFQSKSIIQLANDLNGGEFHLNNS